MKKTLAAVLAAGALLIGGIGSVDAANWYTVGTDSNGITWSIDNHLGAFTKQHIREWCPNLSDSSIEGAVRTLVKNGIISRKGGGRSTYYVKV